MCQKDFAHQPPNINSALSIEIRKSKSLTTRILSRIYSGGESRIYIRRLRKKTRDTIFKDSHPIQSQIPNPT